jgi:hypothetical protein
LPQQFGANIRIYAVFSSSFGQNIVGLHWGEGPVAYHGLRSLAGWGKLRRWKRIIASSADEAIVAFEAGAAGENLTCRSFLWGRARKNRDDKQ